MHSPTLTAAVPKSTLVTLAAGVAAVGYAFGPTAAWLVDKWTEDPQYSHGFLVPLFAAFVVWRALKAGRLGVGAPWPLVGCGTLAACVGARWLAGGLMFHQLDCACVTAVARLALVALTLLAGGRSLDRRGRCRRWGFLIFMVPLPYELERNVGGPLKVSRHAWRAPTYSRPSACRRSPRAT